MDNFPPNPPAAEPANMPLPIEAAPTPANFSTCKDYYSVQSADDIIADITTDMLSS